MVRDWAIEKEPVSAEFTLPDGLVKTDSSSIGYVQTFDMAEHGNTDECIAIFFREPPHPLTFGSEDDSEGTGQITFE